MALSKVKRTIRDGANIALDWVFAKVGTPPSAAADSDALLSAHALVNTSEALINPATEDTLLTIGTYLDLVETKLDSIHTDTGTTLPGILNTTIANRLDGLMQAAPGSDGSTTITSGGTAQNLFSGGTPTNGFEIGNPHPSEDLWITDNGTASANGQGCHRVAANGGTYTTPPGYRPLGAVSIIGATTGHKITARKW